ncbi:MAG: SMI1/KNR4 family protein [Capnocytophaga felis]|nr:SMI1/KNR4 family protein [Capnocytophaga felis]
MFANTLKTISDLIVKSNGTPIQYGKEKYGFKRRYYVSEQEIFTFENTYNIKIPKAYKEFLLTVGSCSLFIMEKTGNGYDFLAPNEVHDWSNIVFTGTDCNLFPEILLTVSIPALGHQAGFLTTKDSDNFGEFYPDIPPEYWIEDTDFYNFEEWLEGLLQERLSF